jgi:serine/threonine protein kinase
MTRPSDGSTDLRPTGFELSASGPIPVHPPPADDSPAIEASERLRGLSPYIVEHSDFRITDTLNKTPTTTVYCGFHWSTGWEIAIKEFNFEADTDREWQFFQREVEILLQCNNSFLPRFLGFTAKPPFSILTEYMVQGSLARILREHPKGLNGCQRTNITLGITSGMRYLHS